MPSYAGETQAAKVLSPNLSAFLLVSSLLIWRRKAKCHYSIVVYFHLNQPETLYSDGNAAEGSDGISKTVAFGISNFLDSWIRTYSTALEQTSFGSGLQAKANLFNSSTVSRWAPAPNLKTALVN